MIRRSLVLLLLVLVMAVEAVFVFRRPVSIRALSIKADKSGAVRVFGIVEGKEHEAPELPAPIGKLTSWSSDDAGTLYLGAQFPSPVGYPYRKIKQTSRVWFKGDNGDRYPLDLSPVTNDHPYAVVTIPKNFLLDRNWADLVFETDGFAPSEFRIENVVTAAKAAVNTTSSFETGGSELKACGFYTPGSDQSAVPHVGVSLKVESKGHARFEKLTIDLPEYPGVPLDGGYIATDAPGTGRALAIAAALPLAGHVRFVRVKGVLVIRTEILDNSKTPRVIATTRDERPFSLILAVHPDPSAPSTVRSTIGVVVADYWPQGQ